MDKREAMKALQEIIERETLQTAAVEVTLKWFWEKRYLPLHGSSLKESSSYHLKWVMTKHILGKFGDTPIAALDRFAMQGYLNDLAKKYGASLIHKVRTYLNAVLEEALYQGFVKRNEDTLLEKPKVDERDRHFLRPEACKRRLDSTVGRDNLILRLLLFCGLRPGELFALRWDDWEPGTLRIDERIWQGRLGSPKTRRSASYVTLPDGLDEAIAAWKQECGIVDLRSWIFTNDKGRWVTAGTWLRENLKPLYWSLKKVLDSLGLRYEILFIDDGSTDGSVAILRQLSQSDQRTRVIEFVRNFGQTAAIAAGFEHARGEIIIPMDADLQNDPQDLPRIISKLQEGYDVVSCWRKKRKDPWFRVFLSRAANRLISWISGVPLHDYGCTLKAYRRNVVRHIRLYGEMHRFIPIYASWAGARMTELEVLHHPRRHGQSKYGVSRTIKVVLDLITIRFLGSFSTKPMSP